MAEVVDDAASFAHAAACDDDAGSFNVVDLARFLDGRGIVKVAQIVGEAALGSMGARFFIEEMLMFLVKLGSADGHGAIEEDGELWKSPRAGNGGEVIEDVLSAANGEGGNEDFAAVLDRLAEDCLEGNAGLFFAGVILVAVGGFEKDYICGGNRELGICKKRGFPAADVAGEEQIAALAALGDFYVCTGRAKDVPGICECKGNTWKNLAGLIVSEWAGQWWEASGVLACEKGRDERATLAAAIVIFTLGIGFLYLQRIFEDDGGEVDGGRGCVDGAVKTFGGEEWQAAAVVQVGVGENNGIEGGGVDGAQVAVGGIVGLAIALEEAAIN